MDKLKVYLQPPQESRGLQRIATALRRYAPSGIEVLSFPRNADLTVIYAIGRRDAIERQVVEIDQRGKRYAIVQVCLRSTMAPNTYDWLGIWNNAKVVWSYYDLNAAIKADGWEHLWEHGLANFYHAPLGVDTGVFYRRVVNESKDYQVITAGLSRLSESVRECHLAVREVGGISAHLGSLAMKGVDVYDGINDNYLAYVYSRCAFVSGLRRKEGFELPAAEGLLCGSRPILFNTEDYRWAYKDWGEYIEETDRQGVVDQLVTLFKRGARPVTAHEREEAAHWFNWERICGEFWQRCLQ